MNDGGERQLTHNLTSALHLQPVLTTYIYVLVHFLHYARRSCSELFLSSLAIISDTSQFQMQLSAINQTIKRRTKMIIKLKPRKKKKVATSKKGRIPFVLC